jgi:hypothetical protein
LQLIRITTQRQKNRTIVTIDGRLVESDVGAVQRVRKSVKGHVSLNLRGLESCAPGGVRLLRAWLHAGAHLQDANPFLQIVLKEPTA